LTEDEYFEQFSEKMENVINEWKNN
jgi:hypothetical protein